MTHYINYDLRQQVAERANFICEYCLLHDDESHFGGEVDHIISLKHGGATLLKVGLYPSAEAMEAISK
jgi:5-methylcytosine-specific restriction endonuclease McrA